MAKRFGKIASYEEWKQPAIVSNTIDILEKEIPKYKSKITSLHLCFTTDPFMYKYSDIEKLTLNVIKLFNDNNITCTVLTKGILPQSLSELSKKNEYGITLISLDETFRKKMEPHSALYQDRIGALKYLHEQGCKTWVSIEPYPTPNIIEQDLLIILNSVSFVDKVIFGRLNYNTKVSKYKGQYNFYNKMADIVIQFCKNRKLDYHIKKGTVK
jgi:DNA repair photolyase